MKNLIYKLVDYLEKLDLGYPVRVGIFDAGSSLVIKPIDGTEVINEYMNGTMDVRIPFALSMKSTSQEIAYNLLSQVMKHFRENPLVLLDDSKEVDYYVRMGIDAIPHFDKEADRYFYYSTKLTIDLTI